MFEIISTSWAQSQNALPPAGSPFGMFLPLIVVFAIFYLLVFRPQQKQQKMKKRMLADLKRGDEVVSNGGIYGKITDLQEQLVFLQIANNVTIKVDRSQINNVVNVNVASKDNKK